MHRDGSSVDDLSYHKLIGYIEVNSFLIFHYYQILFEKE